MFLSLIQRILWFTGVGCDAMEIKVGTKIPELVLPPISRAQLALYAGASGDHNSIHIDSDFAKAVGVDDVFAHGMLSMAFLGRMLTNWQSQSLLKKFSVKFTAITHLNAVVTCSGEVVEMIPGSKGSDAVCKIFAVNDNGEKTLIGEATVFIRD